MFCSMRWIQFKTFSHTTPVPKMARALARVSGASVAPFSERDISIKTLVSHSLAGISSWDPSFLQARRLTGLSSNFECDLTKQTLSHLLFTPATAAYRHLTRFSRLAVFDAATKDGKIRVWRALALINQVVRFRSLQSQK